jgi:hypothetical protein
VKPTYLPARGKNKQALKKKIVFACCVDGKQQKIDLFLLLTTEILNKEYEYKIIARIIENITTQLNENSMKRCILWRFSIVCFATSVVQNLPAQGCKT